MPPLPVIPAPEGFPTEFPSAHAAQLGRLVLSAVVGGKLDPSAIADEAAFPAWVVGGYGGHLMTTGQVKPIFGAGVGDSAYSDEDLATLLIDVSEDKPRFGASYGEEAVKAIPWSLILSLAAQVIQIIANRKK